MNNVGTRIIRSILCCCNPRINISNSHYVCGSNLAFFANMAQVENCLTGFTNKCKTITNNTRNINLDK